MEITGAGPPVDTPLNPARMALSFLDGVIDAVNISMVSTGRNMHGGIQHLEFDRLADREVLPKPWITRFEHTAAAVHPGAGLIHLLRDGLSQMCSLSTAMRVLVRGIASMVVAVPGGAARAHGRAEGLADPFVDLARCSGGISGHDDRGRTQRITRTRSRLLGHFGLCAKPLEVTCSASAADECRPAWTPSARHGRQRLPTAAATARA